MGETNETEPTFSQAQDDLIASAIVSGSTYRQAAEVAGVSRSAVGRRMLDPAFRSGVEHERMTALNRAGHRLGELTAIALDVYEEVLLDPEATTGQRLKAADGVLSSFRSLSADVALAHRFQAIEERLATAEDLGGSSMTKKEIQQ